MSNPTRTIVAGVASMDDQDPRTPAGADPVLDPAIALAAALGAELHVVHAFQVPAGVSWAAPADAGVWTYVAELEERLERQAAAFPGGAAVHCHAVEGSAAEVLCRMVREREAELLVVGASRRGRHWSGVLGSTATQVLAASPTPVLIVRRPQKGAPGRVLLTCDLSAGAGEALRRAVVAVRGVSGGAPLLRCLHVVEADPLLSLPLSAEAAEALARERLDECLDQAGLDAGAVERHVRTGDAAREIAYEATEWGADLVVVATHAHPGEAHHPTGRVAMATIRGAACNVLAIPASVLAPPGEPSATPRDGARSVSAVAATA
ncbi:MAG TPA: universal stress protein [Longimicrobium sp.]|nr:universal stress protein [Longimicrobium sp.]